MYEYRPAPGSRHPWLLAFILAAAAVLRLSALDAQSLWLDELVSWQQASAPSVRDVIERLRGDVHPPLFAILLHFAIGCFGDSEAALRLPSALAGIAAVYAIFRVGEQLWSVREGLAAAALLAVSWTPVQFAQEARSYSLLMLATLAAFGCAFAALRRLERGERVRGPVIGGFWLAATAACHLHYFGLLFVALLGLGLALRSLARPRALAARGPVARAGGAGLPPVDRGRVPGCRRAAGLDPADAARRPARVPRVPLQAARRIEAPGGVAGDRSRVRVVAPARRGDSPALGRAARDGARLRMAAGSLRGRARDFIRARAGLHDQEPDRLPAGRVSARLAGGVAAAARPAAGSSARARAGRGQRVRHARERTLLASAAQAAVARGGGGAAGPVGESGGGAHRGLPGLWFRLLPGAAGRAAIGRFRVGAAARSRGRGSLPGAGCHARRCGCSRRTPMRRRRCCSRSSAITRSSSRSASTTRGCGVTSAGRIRSPVRGSPVAGPRGEAGC